jgi:RNA polymerase sigma-70 factor (ECF subfamily)
MTITEQAEFEAHALAHASELFAAALRYSRNHRDAEDLVQETLLRAFAAWHRFEKGTNCRAWLFRILTNNFINECRRARKERRFAAIGDAAISATRRREAQDPENAMLEGLLADEVIAALSALAPDFRQVVVLADLEGLSYRDIARRIGCPIGTVMSRLFRGRRLLEAALGSYARAQGIARAA